MDCGLIGKDRAYWLADQIGAHGDYAKEAALVLCRQADEIERLRDLLDKRPALNAGTLEAYAAWTGEVYKSDLGLKPDDPAH